MRHLLTLILSLVLVSGLAAQGATAAPLDPLSVAYLGSSKTSIMFEVQAGATGAPNGVWLEWITKAEYEAAGWTGYPVYCTFTGVPTYNTDGTASSYQLGSGETIMLEVGDVFDETGMWASYSDELEPGTEYVVRVYAMSGDGWSAGPWSSEMFEITMDSPHGDCVFTQGYWKNHEEDWPVTNLTLGTVNYTQAQLLSILNTPAGGNGLLILAHQLIATKLNMANGASLPAPIIGAVNDADALIGSLVVPPVGAGYLTPGSVNTTKDTLDNFNNGLAGGSCEPVPVENVTWGQIKATYNGDQNN